MQDYPWQCDKPLLICHIVIPIESFLGDPKEHTDWRFELKIERMASESFVYMVHSRDDGGENG